MALLSEDLVPCTQLGAESPPPPKKIKMSMDAGRKGTPPIDLNIFLGVILSEIQKMVFSPCLPSPV